MAAQAQGKVSIYLHRKRSKKVSLRRHRLTSPSSGQVTTITKLRHLRDLAFHSEAALAALPKAELQ